MEAIKNKWNCAFHLFFVLFFDFQKSLSSQLGCIVFIPPICLHFPSSWLSNYLKGTEMKKCCVREVHNCKPYGAKPVICGLTFFVRSPLEALVELRLAVHCGGQKGGGTKEEKQTLLLNEDVHKHETSNLWWMVMVVVVVGGWLVAFVLADESRSLVAASLMRVLTNKIGNSKQCARGLLSNNGRVQGFWGGPRAFRQLTGSR